MSKICISSCVDDTRVPVRATYVNLYKWPESDVEFVKSAAVHGRARLQSRVVDSISCRQMYLRSYTFSREETVSEKTVKCFGRVKDKVVAGKKGRRRFTSAAARGGGEESEGVATCGVLCHFSEAAGLYCHCRRG